MYEMPRSLAMPMLSLAVELVADPSGVMAKVVDQCCFVESGPALRSGRQRSTGW